MRYLFADVVTYIMNLYYSFYVIRNIKQPSINYFKLWEPFLQVQIDLLLMKFALNVILIYKRSPHK